MADASLMTRLRARLAGEVASDTLEAYRSAGADAYQLFVAAEQARSARAADGPDVGEAFLVATWNAFALQTLGDAFLDADYEADPKTTGFVPPVTAEQALAFYGPVEQWLVRARQAQQDPEHRLDVHVPAELPEWVRVDPCPEPHLHAMLEACATLVEHARLAVVDLDERTDVDPKALAAVHAQITAAETTGEYANQLHAQYHAGSRNLELHERIEQRVKDAVERAYLVGQLAAQPTLVGKPPREPSAPSALPAPGEPGFDPWRLTDPDTRSRWQRDRQARRAIKALWALDPAPQATLAIQAEIEDAAARGDVTIATDGRGRRLGNYYCCPWAPIYPVSRPVTIGGRRLRTLEQFTFDVSAEEVTEGGPFRREILTGSFHPTAEVDYCDPTSGGHCD